jgi:hypothetical protein
MADSLAHGCSNICSQQKVNETREDMPDSAAASHEALDPVFMGCKDSGPSPWHVPVRTPPRREMHYQTSVFERSFYIPANTKSYPY